ncbi:MAG: histidine phosphatase family protein [Sphingomonas sp. 28-62-20]|uniref:SixA phosphatase family protein n=1 Tax=Sphingomonas sp. 28-62-20 TaxID=1970433 RepID=UPI000BCD9252|nr:MAG: histidine phosphatase family protein [Sphingomonas sp. 28-62-20]
MKTLTLLRHAKSGWDDPVARDFDRVLNERGQRAAALIGRHMRALGLRYDSVLASPAIRVVQTLDHLVPAYGSMAEPIWERRIYLASSATLLDLVHALAADEDRVLLVGHNPGLEDLVLTLAADDGSVARSAVEIKFPTASLAEIAFDVADWRDIDAGSGTLTRFVRPRDLDPTLGPDID